MGGYGYLPNDRRHQIKLRGTYAINDNWQIGATLNAQSGRPINAFGVGNPFDGTNYHSYYICVDRCGIDPATVTEDNPEGDPYLPSQRVYEYRGRNSGGRLSWTYNLGASLSYLKSFGDSADLRVKFAVYNLLNHRRVIEVDDELESEIGTINNEYGRPTAFQSPMYGQLTVSLDF